MQEAEIYLYRFNEPCTNKCIENHNPFCNRKKLRNFLRWINDQLSIIWLPYKEIFEKELLWNEREKERERERERENKKKG